MNTITITVELDEELVQGLDKAAAELGSTRDQLISEAIEYMLQDLKDIREADVDLANDD